MAQMGNMASGLMPQMSGTAPQRSRPQTDASDSAPSTPVDIGSLEAPQDVQVSLVSRAMARLMAWLYEGVDMSASQVTGSLVEVEVGMQNDDYAEILSGVNEGQVVLYTGDTTTSSGYRMSGMGGMGGMGGGPMGF